MEKEQWKEVIDFIESFSMNGKPSFNTTRAENSFLQGYARCKNDLILSIKKKMEE